MTRFLDKYIIYYANKWEITHRISFALTGLTIYAFQLLYFVWSICIIPLIIYMAVAIHSEREIILEKDKYIKLQTSFMRKQNATIESLYSVQGLALKYKDAVDAYYNEVLKSRGLDAIKIESKRVGPNSFELVVPPS